MKSYLPGLTAAMSSLWSFCLSAEAVCSHWYPKGDGGLCSSWLSPEDWIPSQDSLPYTRVCHSFMSMILCTAICGSSFTRVKINTEFCMQSAAALIQGGSLLAFTEGRTHRCNESLLFVNSFFTTEMVLKHEWSPEMLQLLHRPVSSYKNMHLQDPGEMWSHGHPGPNSQVPSISHTGMKWLVRSKSELSRCY